MVAGKLVRALSHPLRIRLLQLLEEEPASSWMLREEIDPEISLSGVSYHLGVLYDSGCLERAEVPSRPGADERHYRARREIFLDPLYRAHAGLTEPAEGMGAHWSEVTVDRFGLDQVVDVLRGARLQIAEIERQSKERLSNLEQEGASLVVGVVAFESPGS